MLEKELQSKVLGYLRRKDIWHYKVSTFGSGFVRENYGRVFQTRKGISDLIILDKQGRVIFCELKVYGKKLRETQSKEFELISNNNALCCVLNDKNYLDFKRIMKENNDDIFRTLSSEEFKWTKFK